MLDGGAPGEALQDFRVEFARLVESCRGAAHTLALAGEPPLDSWDHLVTESGAGSIYADREQLEAFIATVAVKRAIMEGVEGALRPLLALDAFPWARAWLFALASNQAAGETFEATHGDETLHRDGVHDDISLWVRTHIDGERVERPVAAAALGRAERLLHSVTVE